MEDVVESVVESYLDKQVKAAGGFTRKVQYVGRRGCPDRLVFLYGMRLVECKRPSKGDADAHQAREHMNINAQGVPVFIINTRRKVDMFVEAILKAQPGIDLV